MEKKRYVIKKYIIATSARDAMRKDRTHHVDEIYCDIDWKPDNLIGFKDTK